MANLFFKEEEQLPYTLQQSPVIVDVGELDYSPIIEYKQPIDIAKISKKTGNKRIGKEIYSLTDLNQITLGLFGFKHQQGTPKPIIVDFLLREENLKIIERHNELLIENRNVDDDETDLNSDS